MKRMSFASMTALKAALMRLAEIAPGSAIIYGRKGSTQAFCQSIDILSNLSRLCSCTHIEIRGVGYFPDAEKAFVDYLKEILPSKSASWWNCCSAHNWLRYNIGCNLHIVALHLASVSYYILVDKNFVTNFRQLKFRHNK